jgi:hypothetical protein
VNFSVREPGLKQKNTSQFIPNPKVQYKTDDIYVDDQEDGFDIYIDDLRHLPDNVSSVKIVAKVIADNREDLIPPQNMWSKISESTVQH